MFKKLLTLKIGAILLGICMFFVIIIAIISAITGTAIGYENLKKQSEEKRGSVTVANNYIYTERYRTLLNSHLSGFLHPLFCRTIFSETTNNPARRIFDV